MFTFSDTTRDHVLHLKLRILCNNILISPSGLKAVPEDIPDDTSLLDLQNNKITEIKENDFKNLKGLHVRDVLPSRAEKHARALEGFPNKT